MEPREEGRRRVRERYQLTDEFVLYAATVKRTRTSSGSSRVSSRASARPRSSELVLIGDEISKYTALRRAVHQHQLHKYVRFLGTCPRRTPR